MGLVHKRLFLGLSLAMFGAGTAQAQVVISQVYGGGGNSGAPYSHDYVELFNRGTTPVELGGKSVQYGSAANALGTGASLIVELPNVSLNPGQYFLVQLAAGANTAAPALPTPDATGSTAMSATTGKVALAEGTTGLNCGTATNACDARIIDLVGFGTANYFEGSNPAPAPSNTRAIFREDNGCTDTDNNRADFAAAAPAPRNSASPRNQCDGAVGTPELSIADAQVAEGNIGTTDMHFTVTLNVAAPEGGVRFDYATENGTAIAGTDYQAANGTITIAEGSTSAVVTVRVIGNTTPEPDKQFYVNISNIEGAEGARLRATGTIINDDVATVAIHAIQGEGQRSPYENQVVSTTGIVTARKNNGYFIQTPDGQDDGNPLTSEGLFIFTGAAPAAEIVPGTDVLVTGTVIEYVPTADPYQLPLTELTNVTTVVRSQNNPLPAPTVLTLADVSADGRLDQLERFESMRVTAESFTVVAPTGGNVNETNATGSSHGRFAVVLTGTERPMREAGLPKVDPEPVGNTATDLPRWDMNPELIAVNSRTLGLPSVDVAAGCKIIEQSLVGPLDYGFRNFIILPEVTPNVQCNGADQPRASTVPGADHATFATYNLQRFFDTEANGPGPRLTAEALERRLNKASIGIRDYLHSPDVLGVTEVENLSVLTTLANRINADALANGQANPGYVAYLLEGNDVGGIDVGYLVRTGDVADGVARVAVNSVEQRGADTLFAEPDGSNSLLNDRPPLVLDAVVHFADGRQYPVTSIVVHHRSLSNSNNDAPGSRGWESAGARVRAKRQAQAEYLATLIQTKQSENPERQIVVLGDFNAFEFNDGLTDVMGVVTGNPSPDNTTVVPGDGSSPVSPALHNATLLTAPSERYSFTFDYNAQSLDHVLYSQSIVDSPLVQGISVSHARLNADFPEIARNDANSPLRLSDHDPTVLLLQVAALQYADLDLSAEAMADSVEVGGQLQFSAVLSNQGPDAAQGLGVGFALNAPLADLQISAGAGFTCQSPSVTASVTSVSCSANAMDNAAEAVFVLSASAAEALAGDTVEMVASATAQTADPDDSNNSATAEILVTSTAVSVPELVLATPVTGLSGDAGDSLLYRIEVPAGTRSLRIMSYGGSGDVSMYAAQGRQPSSMDYDRLSRRPGNNEVIQVMNPAEGTWYIRLVGERAFRNVSLQAR